MQYKQVDDENCHVGPRVSPKKTVISVQSSF